MANLPGSRIRSNSVFGKVETALSSVSTTLASAGLATLAAVSGNHALLTLDPYKEFGNPEIVMVTAHTASATTATIQRGMFGTTARTHPINTIWAHAAMADDLVAIGTSTTRPTDTFEGQLFYEIDTNNHMYWDGAAWQVFGVNVGAQQVGHTFAVAGDVVIASGDIDFIVPMFVPVKAGSSVKLVGARYKVNAGIATVKLQINDVDATNYVGINVITTASTAAPTPITLANNDKISLIVTGVTSSPKNLSFTIYLEHS